MKASVNWLRSYLPDCPLDPGGLAEALTFSGSEVEDVREHGGDHVLDVAVTSNRPDCLCHLGLARELAAVLRIPLRPPEIASSAQGPPAGDAVRLSVEDPTLCPRFCAFVIEGVEVGPSNPWLRDALEAVGLRPVNNVVDITNFVMMELNQPLHAYDLDRLRGFEIFARSGRQGEELEAINGVKYAIAEDDIVIADRDRPVGLAGVMGGLDTEVGPQTRRILLESASFHGPSVRKTARRHQLHSDASYRFERGVDRAGALSAGWRAAHLIARECGGVVRRDPLDEGGEGPGPQPVRLRIAAVRRVAGMAPEEDRIVGILRSLGMEVKSAESGVLAVMPPSFRMDVRREIDLVEEVVRIHGLSGIPETTGMPVRAVIPGRARTLREECKDRLAELGFLEAITADFVPDGEAGAWQLLSRGEAIFVRNPVRNGESRLRRSLLPSLLQVRKLNYDRGSDPVAVFETSPVYTLHPGEDPPVAETHLAGLLADGDLREMRGALEDLIRRAGMEPWLSPLEHEAFESRTAAGIFAGELRVAVFGAISGRCAKMAGLKVRPVYGELDLSLLAGGPARRRRFTGLPRFPAVERDLAVVLREETPYQALEETVRGAGLRDLESLELFDIYRGRQAGEGRKSLAIRLLFRSPARTLLSSEVDGHMDAVMRAIESRLGGEVRKG